MNVKFHKILSYTWNFQNFTCVFTILVKFGIHFLRRPWERFLVLLQKILHLYRASDNSRGRGPAKFRYFREIPRNSQKNTKYREIRQKYFQIHVGKTHLILILAIRPVLFTSNVQIFLETSSRTATTKQRLKTTRRLRWTLWKTGH